MAGVRLMASVSFIVMVGVGFINVPLYIHASVARKVEDMRGAAQRWGRGTSGMVVLRGVGQIGAQHQSAAHWIKLGLMIRFCRFVATALPVSWTDKEHRP